MRIRIRPPRRAAGGIVLALGMVISAGTVWQASNAAFTATTENPTNNWQTGTVTLTDNDNGTAMFSATNMKPGDTALVKCIRVSYTGNASPGNALRFYATSVQDDTLTNPGTGTVGDWFSVKVEEDDSASTSNTNNDHTCTGFNTGGNAVVLFDTTNPGGGTTVNNGSMKNLTTDHATYANARVSGWTPTPATARSYRFTIRFEGTAINGGTVVNATDNYMQGKTVQTTFKWEVRSA